MDDDVIRRYDTPTMAIPQKPHSGERGSLTLISCILWQRNSKDMILFFFLSTEHPMFFSLVLSFSPATHFFVPQQPRFHSPYFSLLFPVTSPPTKRGKGGTLNPAKGENRRFHPGKRWYCVAFEFHVAGSTIFSVNFTFCFFFFFPFFHSFLSEYRPLF